MRYKIVILFSLLFSINHAYAVVTVGELGSGDCDFTTISAALSDGDSEIRIVDNDFTENLLITHAVNLIGGYSDCSHAESNTPEPTLKSYISGTAEVGGSVVKIILSNDLSVKLENLYLSDASKNITVSNGGHGVLIEGTSGTVNIVNSRITNNLSAKGGGIRVSEAADERKRVNIIDSSIDHNDVIGDSAGNGFGGGVYCSGEGNEVTVRGESVVSFNKADKGGGIFADYGCLIFLNSGIDVESSATKRGIMNNTAEIDGGGVYIGNGSRFEMDPTRTGGRFGQTIGDRDRPATVAKNSAGANGGGIYAEFNSFARIEDALIYENSAVGDGGGIYLTTHSKINSSPSGHGCWNPVACLLFSKNTADKGGAVYIANSNDFAHFEHTDFYGNRANDASVMHITGLPGLRIDIYYSNIYGNGNDGVGGYEDFSAFRITNVTQVFFQNITVVDNDLRDDSWVIINTSSLLRLYNSIFHNSEIVLQEFDTAETTPDCLIVNDDTNISSAEVHVESDPGFVDRAGHDYHLRPDSVAVDFCDQAPTGVSGMDHDGDTFGIDIYTRANVGGPFDPGADEYNDHDFMVSDGFE